MQSTSAIQLVDGTAAVVHSDLMRRLMAMVERVARHDAAVLIVGETGAGKELIARAIHQHSLRCSKPFVDVNCAALPEHLVESELFGYEKGAFSGAEATKPGLFELANEGTLLLDEIGELDAKVQAKLLRVLDGVPYYRLGGSRKVATNVRVIAATNRDLAAEVAAGKFRRDLFHRLTQFQLHVPALRERTEDILPLAELFLEQHAPAVKFSNEAIHALLRHEWHGNVRELKNVMFKIAVQLKPGAREVRVTDLPPEICGVAEASPSFEGNLDQMERQMILQAMARCGENQAEAAKQLGISVRTLRRKMVKYRREQGAGAQLGEISSHQQRYFRVSIELPIGFDVDGESVEGTTVNISSGGLAIQSPIALEHGATLQVTFTLPGDDTPIEARTKLAWAGPNGLAGLSIVDMHPALERKLQQWLLEKARAEGWVQAAAAGH